MWDIVWVLAQGHRSVSVSRHFLMQAPQCPCSVQKRFSRYVSHITPLQMLRCLFFRQITVGWSLHFKLPVGYLPPLPTASHCPDKREIWYGLPSVTFMYETKTSVTVMRSCIYVNTNSDVSALIDAIFSAFELLVC